MEVLLSLFLASYGRHDKGLHLRIGLHIKITKVVLTIVD